MTNDELLLRVRAVISTLFEVPEAEVTGDTAAGQLERWDSMGQLSLTLQLEQEFGVALLPEQVERMQDVRSVVSELAVALAGQNAAQ